MKKTRTLLAALAFCALGASAASADVVVRDHRQQPTANTTVKAERSNARADRYEKRNEKRNERAEKRNEKRNERADKRNERANRGRQDRDTTYNRPNERIPAHPSMPRPLPPLVRHTPQIDGVDSSASWYGTIVTISGSYLPVNATVRLDGRTVAPVYVSSQRIIFIAPPSRARTADLVLVAPAGRLDLGAVSLLNHRIGRLYGSAAVSFRWSASS